MRLPALGTTDATIDTDSQLTLRLRGSFGAATTVTVNGHPQTIKTDGTTLTVVLPPHLGSADQPAASTALTPSCTSRTVTREGAAPRIDSASCVSRSTASAPGPSAAVTRAARFAAYRLPAAASQVWATPEGGN